MFSRKKKKKARSRRADRAAWRPIPRCDVHEQTPGTSCPPINATSEASAAERGRILSL